MTYPVLAGCCAHCPLISVCCGGTLRYDGDIPLEKCWVVRPQLLFSAAQGRTAAEKGQLHVTACVADDIQVQLVFCSTFEPVDLPGGGPMEAVGVQKRIAVVKGAAKMAVATLVQRSRKASESKAAGVRGGMK